MQAAEFFLTQWQQKWRYFKQQKILLIQFKALEEEPAGQ